MMLLCLDMISVSIDRERLVGENRVVRYLLSVVYIPVLIALT